MRKSWGKLIGNYVNVRTNLRGIVLIMDIRHPLTDFDTQMLDWAQQAARPCHILLTKADKLGFGAAKNQLMAVRRSLEIYPQQPTIQLFSALARTGIAEAHAAILAMMGHATEER